MNCRITMAVVAERAGVHTTTVSLALRNHPSLPLATRQRLQALAEKMGYQPDPALSALVAYRRQARPLKHNPLLAYITRWGTRLGWQDHPAHRDFFAGAKRKATDLGYQLEHFWLGEAGLTERRLSRILYARGISGLVLASHQGSEGPLDFEWDKFSAVKIDASPRGQPGHRVTNDQRAIMMQAIQSALAAGYRRVGVVMPSWWDAIVQHAWSAGVLPVQQTLPRSDRVPVLYYATPGVDPQAPDYSVPRDLLGRWLDTHRPDVLVSYAPFVTRPLRELGVAVPRDLAYIDTFLEKPDGHLAGMQQNCLRVGELAIELLVNQLHQNAHGVPAIPTTTLVEGTWFDGASLPRRTAPAPVPEPVAADFASPRLRRQRVAV